MNQSGISRTSSLAIVLQAVRCFNAAAFAALAFFYFASYILPPLPSHALKFVPMAQISH